MRYAKIKWKNVPDTLSRIPTSKLQHLLDHNIDYINMVCKDAQSSHYEERLYNALNPIQEELNKRETELWNTKLSVSNKEKIMARRSLSTREIKDGMAYIYEQLVNQNLSARVVSEDPNLPFSLTTYYKYLPKYERQLKANKVETPTSIVEEEMSPTKAIVRNKQRDELLAEQNQQLQEEINTLNRFIVKKFIAGETGVSNENGSSKAGIH